MPIKHLEKSPPPLQHTPYASPAGLEEQDPVHQEPQFCPILQEMQSDHAL